MAFKYFTTDEARLWAPLPSNGAMRVLVKPATDAKPAASVFARFGVLNPAKAKPMPAADAALRARGLHEAERIKAVQERGKGFWSARNDAA
jgi:hypothetical protein